jgi:hypothetical protein
MFGYNRMYLLVLEQVPIIDPTLHTSIGKINSKVRRLLIPGTVDTKDIMYLNYTSVLLQSTLTFDSKVTRHRWESADARSHKNFNPYYG